MPKTHPTYDSGFRQEAVNLLISSQRPSKAVAAELAVSANSLRTWRDRALHQGLAAPAASARGSGPKGRSGGAGGRTDRRAERSDGKSAACNAKTSICADSARS
jgi:transposase-like protein